MKILIYVLIAVAFALLALCLLAYWMYRKERDGKWYYISESLAFQKERDAAHSLYIDEVGKNAEITAKYIIYKLDLQETQDRLSAVLCPRNDHVWIDGRCKRCGRPK